MNVYFRKVSREIRLETVSNFSKVLDTHGCVPFTWQRGEKLLWSWRNVVQTSIASRCIKTAA